MQRLLLVKSSKLILELKDKENDMKGFLTFIREQGIVGLAVGFILGGAISKVVSSFVTDIINPFISIVLGSTQGLRETYFSTGNNKIMYGNFIANIIDFLVIGLVVYYTVHILKMDRLDKKKSS